MKLSQEIPIGYKEIQKIDLKDKKTALKVHGTSFISMFLMLVVFVIVLFLYGEIIAGLREKVVLKLAIMATSIFSYIILHEAVHGVVMKLLGTPKVKFGVDLLHGYAHAGSDCCYGKWAYIAIALAPVVFWGIVLTVLLVLVPKGWFWVVYIVQIMNVGGAAGDFFVTVKCLSMPKDMLAKDSGTEMLFFSATEN